MTSSQGIRRRKNREGKEVDTLSLSDLVDKKFLVEAQDSYLGYLQSSAAIINAEGKYLLGDMVSPYCRFLNQAVEKGAFSSLEEQKMIPKKYLCHHDCYRLSLKAMKTKLPCTEECHGGIMVFAVPVMMDGKVLGCINAGIANPPAEDKKLKGIARKFKVDSQRLLNAARSHAPKPDSLFKSAKKHIVREAEVIAGACERKILEVQVKEMALKHTAEDNLRDKLEERGQKRVLDEAEKYRALLEHASDGIIVADQEGKITFFNKKAEEMLGYDAKKIKGKDVFSIVPSKYRNGEKKARNGFLKTGVSNSIGKAYEAAALRKNGVEVPVEISLSAFKAADTVNFVAILRDITERKEAGLRVRETRSFLEKIIETSMDGMLVNNTQGNILLVNSAIERMTGYKRGDILGKHVSMLISRDEEVRKNTLERIKEMFTKGSASFETVWCRKDGVQLTVEQSSAVIKDEKGNMAGGVSVVKDISERKKAESELREARDFLQKVIETSPDGIRVTDARDIPLLINTSLKEITGYSTEELYRMSMLDFIHPDKASLSEAQRVHKEVFEKDSASYEVAWRRKDGSVVDIGGSSALMKDEEGNIIGGVDIVRDITSRKKIEKEIKGARDFLESVIEASVDGILIMDGIGTILSVNTAVERITGRKREEFVGAHISQFAPLNAERKKEIRTTLMEEFFEKGHVRFEYTWHKEDGTVVEMEQISNLVRDEQGNSVAAISVIRDVTERRRAEKQIKEGRDFLEKVIENSMDGIVITDTEGNIMSVNESIERISGFKREELVGKHISLFSPSDETLREKVRKELIPRLFSEGRIAYESIWQREVGSIINVDVTSALIKDERGNYIGGISVSRDITVKKEAEKTLRETRKFLESVIEYSMDGILICDPKGEILSVNSAVEQMSGYSRDELPGQQVSSLVAKDQRTRKELLEKMKQLYAEGSASFETTWEKKDGSHVEVEQSISFVKNDQGDNIAGVSIARNVTERKSLEHQLLQSQKMETIGTLAGGVAHDFNNILGGILGYASFIKTLIKEENQIYRYIDIIESSAVRAADLTSQLLSFSRGGKYESKPLNINKIIEETLRILYSSIDKGISIWTKLSLRLLSVEGDANQIQQVFLNLFVNARDAMPGGGTLQIETRNVYLDETFCKTHLGAKPGQYLYIAISDKGIGMNQETLDRIFEPFFSTKGQGEGTGLGLSVVYGIIKNHGGYINVYSELGKGTIFKIYLPASSKPILEEEEAEIINVKGKESILVIDDEEVIRDLIKEGLEDLGYTVLTAEDGQVGISTYKERKGEISLVILDLVLPKMSGKITYERLKEIDPQVMVLLSSGYSQKGQAQELLDQGVQGFIQKPFRVKELAREIRMLLDKGEET